MRHFLVPVLLMFSTMFARPAGAFDWPKDLNATVAANRTDISAIEALVHQALNPRMPEVLLVTDFRFVPLETVSRVDLVASVDFSRRGFNSFVAVWQTSDGYGSAVLPSNGNSLATDVLDLDRTGVFRVVAGEIPGGYQGIETLPIPWYAIYALKEGKWTNVSDRYPHFSRSDRDFFLVSQLADACDAGNKNIIDLYRNNALFVRFKFDRMVMHNRSAGLETALDWASSPVHNIQLLAVETLREIADPRAVAALRKLADGPDTGVRIFAKDALAHPENSNDKK